MAEIRVGDWVEMISPTEVCGPVESVGPGHSVTILARDGKPLTSARSDFQHRAPDPLPETLPEGTEAVAPSGVRWRSTAKSDEFVRGGGWACEAVVVAGERPDIPLGHRFYAVQFRTDSVDWPSYHAALHREQDEASGAKDAYMAAELRATKPIKLSDPDAFERTRAAMGTYVPKPGERVRIDQCEGLPYYEGKIRTCVAASLTNGEVRMFADWPGSGGEAYALLCHVSPLTGPIDVECPLCKAQPGGQCVAIYDYSMVDGGGPGTPYAPGSFHPSRDEHFLALTGGKDSGRAAGAQAADDAGSQDTGRTSSPAAPSGFNAPPKEWRCIFCLQPASVNATNLTGVDTCGDCANDPTWRAAQHGHPFASLDDRIRAAKDKLRTDLDRPLPKPAALRTWPERAGEDYEL